MDKHACRETDHLIEPLLHSLYGSQAADLLPKVQHLIEKHTPPATENRSHHHATQTTNATSTNGTTAPWNQHDSVLITYGDQLLAPGETPLATLNSFLHEHQLDSVIGSVHLLPFYPYSSDDGFSVIDYREVDPQLGTWHDIANLAKRFDLMFDLVLNHVSQQSRWFSQYQAGAAPYDNFFIAIDQEVDLSAVVRPRSLPLLTPFETEQGRRHVWTTFSDDQVDLNFAEPAVLLEMIDVLLGYVSEGARFIRLDAIAYLWKEIGTSCIHLPQTHSVVKLLRQILLKVDPSVLLLTETNVPHEENVSYFGNGDEAHMVYQFSLPPLLLDAFLREDATPLKQWLTDLQPPPAGCTYFNFTASHDGIGVRPLEGLLDQARFDALVDDIRQRGGKVNTRRNLDGSDSAYELNITYYSALSREEEPIADQVRRFLTSQAIMLAMQGIPGIYFHSLFGTENDQQGAAATGHARQINRRKFERQELQDRLQEENLPCLAVLQGYRHLLQVRSAQAAFHPDGAQQMLPLEEKGVVGFTRISPGQKQQILCLFNVTGHPKQVDLAKLAPLSTTLQDLLTGEHVQGVLNLPAYGTAWLS